MKTLMLLGGSNYIIPVIEKAHELGIYVMKKLKSGRLLAKNMTH